MKQAALESGDDQPPHPESEAPCAAPAGVLDELSGAFASARAAMVCFLDLLRLEARLAGRSLLWMLALALFAALCFISAWLGLTAALVIAIASAGYGALAAALIVSVLNLLSAVVLILICLRLSCNLRFTATRRQFGASRARAPVA